MKLLVLAVAAQTVISTAAEECIEDCVKAKHDIFGSNDDACISFRKQLPRPMMGNSCYKGFWAAVEDFCKENCDNSEHRMHAGQACREFKTTLKSGCFHGYTAGSSFALAGHSLEVDTSSNYSSLNEVFESSNNSKTTQYHVDVEQAVVAHKDVDALIENSIILVDEMKDTAHENTLYNSEALQGQDLEDSDLDVKEEDREAVPYESFHDGLIAEANEGHTESRGAQSQSESGAMTVKEETGALFEDASSSIDKLIDTALYNTPYHGGTALRLDELSDLKDKGEKKDDTVSLATPQGHWV
jgi:hypothetical protein